MMADFIVVDVETANAFLGSICQIGIVRFVNGVEASSGSYLINPNTHFDPMNVNIHGIDEEAVSAAPEFPQVYKVLSALPADTVLVCHTHFDRSSIRQACEAWSLPKLELQWLDSARVARRAWEDVAKSGYGLAALAARFGITFRHHDAEEDARTAGLILLRAIADSKLTLDEWLTRASQPISLDSKKPITRTANDEGVLSGERVVFTGALVMVRREAADIAAAMGAAVDAGVTKNTTMLVVGDQDVSKLAGHTKSSKHRKAEQFILGGHTLRIVAERDFIEMCA